MAVDKESGKTDSIWDLFFFPLYLVVDVVKALFSGFGNSEK